MLGGLRIKVASLDALSGRKTDQITLASDSDISTVDSILFVGANSASPLLVWTDKGHKTLKVNIIGTKGVASFNIDIKNEEVSHVTVHAPHRIRSVSHFLVHFETSNSHWAEVYHVDLAKSSVTKAYNLPKLPGRGAFTTSTTDANVYFTRITDGEISVVSSASHGILGRFPYKPTYKAGGQASPIHGVSEVVVRSDAAQAVRSAVLFSDGEWSLIRNGELVWARPEFLAGAAAAVWADVPEEEALAHELEIEGHENIVAAYTHRVRRHVRDLEHLPSWLQNLPQRILASFIGRPESEQSEEITQDTFGFNQLVVVATENGRMAALDAGRGGRILWNIDLARYVSGNRLITPVLKSASRGIVELRDPTLQRPLLIEAITGELQSQLSPSSVPADAPQTVVNYQVADGRLRGFLGDGEIQAPVWDFTPAPGERIVGVAARPQDDPVASIGKVLGDRRVLYKYINPNLVLVTTVLDSAHQVSIYLLDSVSGNLLYTATHDNVDVSRAIASVVSENWLAYSLTTMDSSKYPSRGYQLVVAEMFESSIPNDRGPLGASANFSSLQPSSALSESAQPYVVSQTYQIAEEISHMAVTHTKQGITSRQLLVVLPESQSIVGIPRQVIDPRRPIGRDPTAAEASEGLTKYSPALEFDPKWYLNHKREVIGIKKIITSPALLESTSLVFAYGLDIFGTRVSPSFTFDVLGKDFNKLQMLATVVALFFGVLFVAPLVSTSYVCYRVVANLSAVRFGGSKSMQGGKSLEAEATMIRRFRIHGNESACMLMHARGFRRSGSYQGYASLVVTNIQQVVEETHAPECVPVSDTDEW